MVETKRMSVYSVFTTDSVCVFKLYIYFFQRHGRDHSLSRVSEVSVNACCP